MSDQAHAGQTAFQRWELSNFDASSGAARSHADPTRELQRVADLAAARETARREGREEGLRQGRAEGLAAAHDEISTERARLSDLAGAFEHALTGIDEAVAQQLLELSLDIAQAMLRQALRIRPELVIPLVRDLLKDLPIAKELVLTAHPDDVALLERHVKELSGGPLWRLAGAPDFARGECTIDTPTNLADGRFPARWTAITAALGTDTSWLSDEPT